MTDIVESTSEFWKRQYRKQIEKIEKLEAENKEVKALLEEFVDEVRAENINLVKLLKDSIHVVSILEDMYNSQTAKTFLDKEEIKEFLKGKKCLA